MRKIFVFIIGLFVAGTVFAVGENVPTSKSYVDTAIAQKQDTIPANSGAAQVLTNTGTPGDVDTKNIYDSSADYAGQTDALVTAGAMNAAVQNAIETEFKCIEWVDNDPSKDCLLLSLFSAPNIANMAVSGGGSFDPTTGIFTNPYATPKTYLHLYITPYRRPTTGQYTGQIFIKSIFSPQLIKQTFTTGADDHYILVKHNDSRDVGIYMSVEPLTQYTILVDVLETNPSVIGGLKMKIMLVRGEWNHDYLLAPGENIYMPHAD